VCYPFARLREEVAFIAYHFHWSYDQLMEMDHLERQQWVSQIAAINKNLNE